MTRPRRGARRRLAVHTRLALLLTVLGAIVAVVPWPQSWIERAFARGWFPVVSRVLAPTVGEASWSVSAALTAVGLAIVLATLPWRRGRRWLLRSFLPWSSAALVLGFSLTWGLAYRRDPAATLLNVPTGPPTAAQVDDAAARLLAVARATASSPDPTTTDVAAASRCVSREVARLTGQQVATPRRVAILPAGTLLRFGFAGITWPWLLEPHVDGGLPPVARLATSIHELTHAAGFAREADTDALAVLAGLRCDDPTVRYAVAVHALSLLLAAESAPRRAQTLATLPERVLADLQAADRASAHYRVAWLERPATALYGGYLRSRGVSSGMADYGRALTIIVQALTHGASA